MAASRRSSEAWETGTGVLISVTRTGPRRGVELHIMGVGDRAHLIGNCEEPGALALRQLPAGSRITFMYRRGRYCWEIRNVTQEVLP